MALLGTDTQVTGPLPDGVLLLETFQGNELLGTPYGYNLTLLSADPNIAVDKVLGQSMTVQIKLDSGDFRYFNGIVTYFAKTGLSQHHTRYVAVLNPKLALFGHARDCRILFDADAPTHATDVLGKRGFTDVESGKLQGSYRKREYTVQYRETDFNFVQRLLEEEGIYYFFKHEKDKHTLVMADSASAHAAVPGYDKVLYMPKERKQVREEEHFWSLSAAGSLYPGKYSVLRGYDYTKPRPATPQIEEKSSLAHQPGADFEDYDYPDGLYEKPDAEAEAAVRLEGGLVANTLIQVEGNTMGLGVGDLVKLRKPLALGGEFNPFWNDADFDKEYLITSATYAISINQYETGDVAKSDEPFKATYTLLDSQSRFRPARTKRKPRIEGPQTAIVVGPSADEIYTDKFGRVKVQFDWDRLGKRDEKSSIWIRVSQVWAGKQWGAMHIPRIGHEVIVAFLDGDPDRPIITGRVYNTDNMPPYALPDNKTQSGIKSRSSKSGSADNFNEIRFEDLKGKEELHIQAEKDMSTLVKHNESLSVGGDRSVSVTGNQSVTITGKGKSPIHSTTKVTGKYDLDVSDTIHIKAPTSITLECPGSKIEMLPGKITITAGGGATIVLDANALVQSSAGAKVLLDSNALAQSVPGAKLLLDGNVLAQSVAGSKVALDANAMVEGVAKATVSGSAEATLTAGGGTVKTSPSGVDASGPMINVTGSGMVSISGAMVKVNG
jgi:type VI secretion system secreted protein VgrG